jgi:WhiB family redox-sensing transcriptional regulator
MDTKRETAWQDRAACIGKDPNIFFSEDEMRKSRGRTAREKIAKAVCKPCPVSGNCLQMALTVPETVGVWGGTSTDEREKIKRIGKARSSCIRCRGRTTALAEGAQVCVECGLSWLVREEKVDDGDNGS